MCSTDFEGPKKPVPRAIPPSPANSAKSALSSPSDPSVSIRRQLYLACRWCASMPLLLTTRRPLYVFQPARLFLRRGLPSAGTG
jgi:hypothetical protein